MESKNTSPWVSPLGFAISFTELPMSNAASDLSFTPTHLRWRCWQAVGELEGQSQDPLLRSWGCWRLSSCATRWTPFMPPAMKTLGPLLPTGMVVAVLPLSLGGWVSFTCEWPPLTAKKSELHALFLSRQSETSAQGPWPQIMPERYDRSDGCGLRTLALSQIQGNSTGVTQGLRRECSDSEKCKLVVERGIVVLVERGTTKGGHLFLKQPKSHLTLPPYS